MAKRKKNSWYSSKCPEPLNSLIDIAGGLAMGAIANHMENKYHYTAKGKVNPYAVSAFGIASGKLKTTEDLLRTGAALGALGSFDVEPSCGYGSGRIRSDLQYNAKQKSADEGSYCEGAYEKVQDNPLPGQVQDFAVTETNGRFDNRKILDDPLLSQIKETVVNDNRYAWRLNCEDGSCFGVSPNDYETRDDYNRALRLAMGGWPTEVPTQGKRTETPNSEKPLKQSPYLCCRVSRLDNGANEYYLSEDESIQVGNTITVQTDGGTSKGVVIGVKRLSEMSADELPDVSMWIISQDHDDDMS